MIKKLNINLKKRNFLIIMFLVLIPILYFVIQDDMNAGIPYKLIVSVIVSLITVFFINLLLNTRKDEIEKEKQLKEVVRYYSTDQIREFLKRNNWETKLLEREFKKRKDRNTYEKIGEQVEDILWGGIMILVLAVFYFGAVSSYFNVNDEFTNPTNQTGGYESALNLVQNTTYTKIFLVFHNQGKEHPTLWFWMWWVVVATFLVYPILKIIYILIKPRGGKSNV